MDLTIACPACRAENGTSPCRRCRVDLSLLFALERRRGQLVKDAARAIRLGHGFDALNYLDEARFLRPGEDLDPFQGLAHLLDGDYEEAVRIWRKAEPEALATEEEI